MTILYVVQRPFEIFAPKSAEVDHDTHVEGVHFIDEFVQVLNGHGKLMIVNVDEREFGPCKVVFRNLECGNGVIRLHVHDVQAVLDQTNDPIHHAKKEKHSDGHQDPFPFRESHVDYLLTNRYRYANERPVPNEIHIHPSGVTAKVDCKHLDFCWC